MGGLIQPPAHLPLLERWGKQLRHAGQLLEMVVRQGRMPLAVVVSPDLPSRRTTLYKVCRHLGWELTNCSRPDHRVVLYLRFEDATEKATPLPTSFPPDAWNARCTDIGKSTLDAHHQAIWGYGLKLDPLTHQGPLLEKGNGNALHDGRIVQGPLASDDLQPDKVYQRIVDNRAPDGRPVDLRLVWLKGSTPVLYHKYKSESARFTNETVEVTCAHAAEEFSEQESAQISALMAQLGVDWAELDILRDRNDGRIYVVDINPTPWGPPAQLPAEEAQRAVAQIAAQLRNFCSQRAIRRTSR